MSWGQPQFLWALLLPIIAAAVARRGGAMTSTWPGLARVAVSGAHVRALSTRRPRRPWFLLIAVTLAVLALARPRWGANGQAVAEPAREVMIALDLSRSMDVEDVAPTRMDRAHEIVMSLLDGLGGERAGIIVFAGGAYVQVPLSSDYQIMREFLPELKPGFLPLGGTDYTAMLRAAQEGFSEDKDMDRYLVVISDGESTTAGWPAELAQLRQRGVHVIALGVGTAAGGNVPPSRYEEKSPGRSQLEADTLQKMAATSDGIYRDATVNLDVKGLLAASVELGRRSHRAEREAQHQEERFQWFLLPALILGLLGLWQEIAVRPRARPVQRHSSGLVVRSALVAAAPVMALLLLAGSTNSFAHDLADEADEPITAIGKLRKLIAHVAAHPFLDLNDLKRIGELTVNYGIESYAKGESLSEGALADALEAVRYGEEMAPQFAEWEHLRSELKRLQARPMEGDPVARPPEQKKEALDEEDKPPQTNGQGSQQTSSESTGKGGVAMTDATLGELRKEPAKMTGPVPEDLRYRNAPKPGGVAEAVARAAANPLRNLLIKRYRQVAKEDRPGELFQALNGDAHTVPDGGKDW
jgi:Ca-activated chloride channel family protein